MKIYGPKLIIMEFATKHKSAKDFYRSLGAVLAINDVIVIALNRNEQSEELFVHESWWKEEKKNVGERKVGDFDFNFMQISGFVSCQWLHVSLENKDIKRAPNNIRNYCNSLINGRNKFSKKKIKVMNN